MTNGGGNLPTLSTAEVDSLKDAGLGVEKIIDIFDRRDDLIDSLKIDPSREIHPRNVKSKDNVDRIHVEGVGQSIVECDAAERDEVADASERNCKKPVRSEPIEMNERNSRYSSAEFPVFRTISSRSSCLPSLALRFQHHLQNADRY
jgi:hypothetical protein